MPFAIAPMRLASDPAASSTPERAEKDERIGGKGLQRAGERVHGAVERARAAWLAEEPVDIGREARIQRRVGGARGLEPELALGDEVDDALDVAGAHAGGALARELLDRREAAAGVARRVGVRDVLGNDADAGLRDAQAGGRRIERRQKAHRALPSAPDQRIMLRTSASICCEVDTTLVFAE